MLLGVFSCINVSAEQTPAGIAVSTESEFLAMSSSGDYYLKNDITLSKTYANGTFMGSFDGNGHKITLSGNKVYSVFSAVDGTVKDLVIEGNVILNIN